MKMWLKLYVINSTIFIFTVTMIFNSIIIKFIIQLITPRYLFDYQEPIPVENMVKVVCNYKQAYTQYGGLRPFGVAFLFAGWDKHYGFQLYQVRFGRD